MLVETLETNLADLPLFRSVMEKPRYRFTFGPEGGVMTVEALNVDANLEIENLQRRIKPPEPELVPVPAPDIPVLEPKIRASVKKKKVHGGNVQYFTIQLEEKGVFYFRTKKSIVSLQEIFAHTYKHFGRISAVQFKEAKKSHGARLSSLSSIVKLV